MKTRWNVVHEKEMLRELKTRLMRWGTETKLAMI